MGVSKKMKFPFNGKEIYINGFLSTQLNTILYNIRKDWDFVIVITGDRTVRVGKSVLAMQVCAYLSYGLNKMKITDKQFGLKDIYFNSRDMTEAALKSPKYSIFQYDEGRESLAASKYLTPFQQDLLDYFAECGQLNHIFVVVLPDYFGLAEEIAVPRSEFLLNVYRKEEKRMTDLFKDGNMVPVVKFTRGNFEFFNKYKKQKLYDLSKVSRKKNYGLLKCNFLGDFTNNYPIDEKEYRKLKAECLKKARRKKVVNKVTPSDIIRNKIVLQLHNEGKTSKLIQEYLKKEYNYDVSDRYLRTIIHQMRFGVGVKGGAAMEG